MANKPRPIPSEPVVLRFAMSTAGWCSVVVGFVLLLVLGMLHDEPGHHPYWYIVLGFAAAASVGTAVITPLRMGDRRKEIDKANSWNRGIARAQGWMFPLKRIEFSSWNVQSYDTESEQWTATPSEQPEHQVKARLTFLPVGVSDPKPIEHVLPKVNVYWDGHDDSEENAVSFPHADVSSSGRIRSYGKVAVLHGRQYRDFPLWHQDADTPSDEPTWQIAS